MNRRHVILGLALALALGLALFGERGPADAAADLVAPAEREAAPHPARTSAETEAGSQPSAQQVLRLRERPPPVRLAMPEGGQGLFRAVNWDPPSKPQAAPPPTAPPLPYAFVGQQRDAQGWQVFLARGNDVRVARLGMVLDGEYRVERVQPPSLVLRYLPLDQTQTLTIGSAE